MLDANDGDELGVFVARIYNIRAKHSRNQRFATAALDFEPAAEPAGNLGFPKTFAIAG